MRSIYFDIITGRRRGPAAALVRGALSAASRAYGLAIAVRNRQYDRRSDALRLPRPCISVGNITAGGTGKTPLIAWLASRLLAGGLRPAILSRGYKSRGGFSDELAWLSEVCPHAIIVAHPDRAAAGQRAISEGGADVVLLDDGYQHRRLARDLDIVLVDASCPFGYGHLLPRGMLREPPSSLGRADCLVITRAGCVGPAELAGLRQQLHRLRPAAPILACDHLPAGLVALDGARAELHELAGRRLLAVAGIGNPAAFEHTLIRAGLPPLRLVTHPDHHPYTSADLHNICKMAGAIGAEAVVTTEKDLVKLRRLSPAEGVPVWALQITVDFAADGGKMLLELVLACIARRSAEHPARHNANARRS